ncbi:hypothetical protein LTR17_006092 [Elasticomyces elasticus]|nr:hypothetical protein LTR17_006092 [Elasticomyces elasticus]
MVFSKNWYKSVNQQLEEAYEIVQYQNHKLNTLKEVVAEFMDGLNIQALIEEYSDDKESLEQIVLERASCRITRRGETRKPLPPAEPVAQTSLPTVGPVAETNFLPEPTIVAQPELPPTTMVAQTNLPPTTIIAQPRRKHGKLLGPKMDSPHGKWTHKKSRTPSTRTTNIKKPSTVTSHQ